MTEFLRVTPNCCEESTKYNNRRLCFQNKSGKLAILNKEKKKNQIQS